MRLVRSSVGTCGVWSKGIERGCGVCGETSPIVYGNGISVRIWMRVNELGRKGRCRRNELVRSVEVGSNR